MASVTLLFFGLMLSVPAGNSITGLFKLKCEPAVGVIGQTTNISCSMESQNKDTSPIIKSVVITRIGAEKPSFTYQPYDNTMTGDPRFKVLSDSSLQLQNTNISDKGEYKYFIMTTKGVNTTTFTISVTAEQKEKHRTELTERGTWTVMIVMVVIACLSIVVLITHWFLKKHTRPQDKPVNVKAADA